MAAKTFINQTNSELFIQLFLRSGSDPANGQGVQAVHLAVGQQKQVQYGNDQNPYLDGMAAMIVGGSDPAPSIFQYVLERSSAVDNLYNQNDIITISSSGQTLAVQGSNG